MFRIEQAKLIAGLTRLVRDVGVAEELAQDALVAALEQWQRSGIPDKPGAWLMAAAKNRAIDRIRHEKLRERKHAELGYEIEIAQGAAGPDLDAALDDEVGDDLLRLLFSACHPALKPEAQAALTLRLLGGLTTDEIARAFLSPEPTIAQRIVRAKRTLAEKRVPFEVPRGEELASRLASVLAVIYLIFNEGYAATAGQDWMRPRLCEEALARGEALIRAQRVGPGPYVLQAAIAACHARARTAEETDWARIVGLYGKLAEIAPSPVVELNRAVALAMLFGPEAGLRIVDALTSEPALKAYHLLPSVRGDLLKKLGRLDEARAEFERAAALTENARERALLLDRAEACGRPSAAWQAESSPD